MTDEHLPHKPEITFDSNSPQGFGADRENKESLTDERHAKEHGNGAGNKPNAEVQDHHHFSPGFSDGERSGEACKRPWPCHRAKRQAAEVNKDRKSSRRSDDESEGSETNARAKRPRQSMFGGADGKMEIDKQVVSLFVPPTPGHGLGNRMSSLTLGQQQDDDEVAPSIHNGLGLAYSDTSDDERTIPSDTVPYYELRQNIDRQKAITHVDTDKSGNFDPEREAKEKADKSVRAKAAQKNKTEKRRKKSDNDAPRGYVMKCIVKLPFDAFGNARNITNDEQNWPEDWSEIDSEQERELEKYRAVLRARSPDRRPQKRLEDPAGQVDDITGHPVARGCKQCRKFEKPCSMMNDGKYPCGGCVENDGECQPIQEPKVKGRCKQCDQAKVRVCSFEENPAHPICDHCADNDHICKALPPDGYKAPRVNIEEVIWGPDRPHVACTACRKDKKRCTLKKKEDKPPCKYCAKNNLGCTFFHIPDREKQTTKKKTVRKTNSTEATEHKPTSFTQEDIADMTRRNTHVLEHDPTPEIEMEDGKGNKGALTKITTSFAHPIQFNVQMTTISDCNFCEMPVFGMVGHFEREVHVIRWHNGLGYAEVGGGHCQDTGTTKMCGDCTNRRVQIIVCPDHEFERMTVTAVDHDALAEELAEAEIGGPDMQYQLQRWCSVCFSPAVYGCCTVQPSITGQEEVEVTGCHLRLCVACEQSLRESYGGDLNQMVVDMDNKPKISEADEILGREIKGKPRADVGFLRQDGLLMVTVEATD